MNFDFFSWFCCYNNGQQNRPEPQNSEELQRKVAIMRKFTKFHVISRKIQECPLKSARISRKLTDFQEIETNFKKHIAFFGEFWSWKSIQSLIFAEFARAKLQSYQKLKLQNCPKINFWHFHNRIFHILTVFRESKFRFSPEFDLQNWQKVDFGQFLSLKISFLAKLDPSKLYKIPNT